MDKLVYLYYIVLVVIVLSVPAAVLLHKVHNAILRKK